MAAAFLVSLVVLLVVAISYVQLIGPLVLEHMNERSDSKLGLVGFVTIVGAPLLVLLVALGFVWAGIVSYIVDGSISERSVSLARAAGASLRKVPAGCAALLGLLSLVILTFVLAPVISLAGLGALITTPLARRSRWADRWPPVRVLVVMAVPFVVPVLLAIRLSLTMSAIWLDGLSVRDAATTSWNRVHGSTGLVGGVLALASIVATGVVGLAATMDASGSFGSSGVAFGQLIAQLLVAPLPIVAATVLYRSIAAGGSPLPGAPQVAPLPGSGRRQVAVMLTVAMGLQLVVWLPTPGLSFTDRPVAATDAFRIELSTSPASPFQSGIDINVDTDVWDPSCGCEDGGPIGEVVLLLGSDEFHRYTLTGNFSTRFVSTPYQFPPGTHDVVAQYVPDPSDSRYPQTEKKITVTAGSPSTTTLSVDPAGGTSFYGNTVKFTADVKKTGSTTASNGWVRFEGLPGGPVDKELVGGRAEVELTQLPPADYNITAKYNVAGSTGGSHLPSESSAVAFTVEAAKTIVSVSTAPASPSAAGANVTATVTVTPSGTSVTPTGSITVKNSAGATLATGALDGGSVKLDLALAPGTHDLLAIYTPGTGFAAVAPVGATPQPVPFSHTVSRFISTVTLSASPGSSVRGQSVALTAQVPGQASLTATGSITVKNSAGATLATGTLANGSVTVNVTDTPLGSNQFIAHYTGDVNFSAAASDPLPHTVSLASASVDIRVVQSTPVVGDKLNVNVDVAALAPGVAKPRFSPLGTVDLYEDGTLIDSQSVAVSIPARFEFVPSGAGVRQLKATYSGNTDLAGTSTEVDVTIARRLPTVTLFAPAACCTYTYGDSISLSGSVSGGTTTPTGTVALSANGIALGDVALDGSGRFNFVTDLVQAGPNIELVASYQGDATFLGGDTRTSPRRVRVDKASASPAVSVSGGSKTVGDRVQVTADLSDSGVGPTGSVTFSTGSGTIGTSPVANGSANIDLILTGTTTWVSATYSGDANFTLGADGPVRVDAARAPSLLRINDPGTLHYGDVVTLRVQVDTPAGVPNLGDVDIRYNGSIVLAFDLPITDGEAAVDVCAGDNLVCPPGMPTLGLGTPRLEASFAGTSVIEPANATIDVDVVKAEANVVISTNSATPCIGCRVVLTAAVGSKTSAAQANGEVFFETLATATGARRSLGSAPLVNGVATLQFDADADIAYPIDTVVARYYGEFRRFGPGTASTSLILDRRDVALVVRAGSGVVGERIPVSVVIRATEPGVPAPFTGLVTLTADNGDSCTGRFPASGPPVMSCLLRWETAGPHQVSATYAGDEIHDSSTSDPADFVLAKRPSSLLQVSAPARVFADTTFTISWNFDPTATGTITVLGQPGCVDVAVSAGGCLAWLDRSAIARTDNLLRVRYSGNERWTAHQFELAIQVDGCYTIEVFSANPSGGSVALETPTNCATDTTPGYRAGTRVTVEATATGRSEFVRWRSGIAVEDTERAVFTVTDDFDSWLLFADFQLACFPVDIAPIRGEPGNTRASDFGTVTLDSSRNSDNGGTFDGRCRVVGGGAGFEVGTTVSFSAVPELNPTYGESDLVYGFDNLPTGAVVSTADGRAALVSMVVSGPIASTATFGPRCRSVATRAEPADDAVVVRVERAQNCTSPFGDGYRKPVRAPSLAIVAEITGPGLYMAGWTIDGSDATSLGTRERVYVTLGAGDLDVVARVRRCHTLTIRNASLPNPDSIDNGPAAEASPVTPPNCPDGSNRYLTDTEVTVGATLRNPLVELAWSDNVTPDEADGTSGIVAVTDDVEVSPNFFLGSVCSQLTVDDPLGLVDLSLMDAQGWDQCGDGYYLDYGKARAQGIQVEVEGVTRDSYTSDGDYQRALERTETRLYSRLPIRLASKTELASRGIDLPAFADVETWGGPGFAPDCFPMTCGGPVTGNLHITASVCQTIQLTGTITVQDDPTESVYTFYDVPKTTMTFGDDGTGTQQPLRPWIESTDLSDPVRKYNDDGSFTGFERSACESFENAQPPGAKLSVRAGVTVPGLYLDGWTDEVNIPVTTDLGFEYQTILIAEESSAVQTVNAEFVAVCRTLSVGTGIRVVDSPPNCPGSNSYIVGSFVKVRAEKFLGSDTYLRSPRWTKQLYEFSEGIIPGSKTYVACGAGECDEPYTEAYVYIDNDKSVGAKYRSENDQVESALVTSAKLLAGVTALAVPVLLTSIVCAPCGMALGALATTSVLIDLIPGVDGKASAAFDLINPTSFFQCVGKWGANTPTPPRDPVADGGPPISAIDQLGDDRLKAMDEVIDGIIALAEDPIENLPGELVDATEALVLNTIESITANPEDLPVLRSILFDGGDEADFSVVQPESWTLDGFTELKEDAQFLKKAAKTLKRIRYYRNLKTAFTQGYATEGLIGITGRLKGGWKAIKDQRKLVRASRNPATSAAKLKAAAALEFVSELNDAGYLSIDGLSRNNGYQSVADLAGTATFTDCLEDKYRLAL